MADTGWKFPTQTGSSIASYLGNQWENQTNAYADDGVYTTCILDDTPVSTDRTASYYSFDFGIPNGAFPIGLEFESQGYVDSGTRPVIFFIGYYASGTIGAGIPTYGTAFYNTWTTTETVYSYGSASNLNLFPSGTSNKQYGNSFFAVVSTQTDNSGRTIYLDYIKMRVTYAEPTSSLLPFFYP